MNALLSIALIGLVASGCVPSLAEIHSDEPRQSASFQVPYKALASCAKEQAQTQEWKISNAVMIESIEGATSTRLFASVYSSLARTVLFEMTFLPAPQGITLVEYRDPWPSDATYAQAWPIIERCAQNTTGKATPAR